MRKFIILISFIILSAAMYACGSGGAASTNGLVNPPKTTPGQAASVALTSSARIVHIGNTIPLTASVVDNIGRGVPGVAVVFTSTGAGTMNTNYALTDAKGNASATIFSSSAGSSTVKAFSNTLASNLDVYFVDGTIQNALSISVDSNSNNIFNEQSDFVVSGTSGDLVKLWMKFTDASGAPIPNKTITMSSDSSNLVSFSTASLTTDGNGNAYTFATFNSKGNAVFVDIIATAADGTVGSVTLNLQPFIVGDILYYSDRYTINTGDTANLKACLVSASGAAINMNGLKVNFTANPATSVEILPFAFTDATGCATNPLKADVNGIDNVTVSFAGIQKTLPIAINKPVLPLTVIPNTPSVTKGDTILMTVTGGVAPYSVTSLNPSLTNPATWIVQSDGGTLQITALAIGSATLVIRDSTGSSVQATLAINDKPVQPLNFVPASPSVTQGSSILIAITGGVPPYTVTSLNQAITNPSAWTVASNGGTFQVTGVATGLSTINITDSANTSIQTVLTINAASVQPLAVIPGFPSVTKGQSILIAITGGVPPYAVTSLNPSLTNPTSWNIASSGGTFQVNGVGVGSSVLLISDSAKSTTQISLTINNVTVSPLTAIPAAPSVTTGKSILIAITGGVPPYTVTSLNPSLTDPGVWTVASDGATFQVTGVAPGFSTLMIRDSIGTIGQAILTIN